jgi:prepilin peptidase CpaA
MTFIVPILLSGVIATGIAAWTDYRTGLIPNWLTLGGTVAAGAAHAACAWLSGGWQAAAYAGLASLAGVVFCTLAPGVLYWKGAMGGGDLKLFAAIGALYQPMLGIQAQMYAFVIAAVLAPARLAYEGRLMSVLGSTLAVAINPVLPREKRRPLPPESLTWFRLGPAIFAGTLLAALLKGYSLLAI